MQDINQDNIEQWVASAEDPDLIKELMVLAVKWERDDLVDLIIEKAIQVSQLIPKLHAIARPSHPATVISFLDNDEPDLPVF